VRAIECAGSDAFLPMDEFDIVDKLLQSNGNSRPLGKELYCGETGQLFPIVAICAGDAHERQAFRAFAFRYTSRQDSSEFATGLLGKMTSCGTKDAQKQKRKPKLPF
jgi:hypothetical protein